MESSRNPCSVVGAAKSERSAKTIIIACHNLWVNVIINYYYELNSIVWDIERKRQIKDGLQRVLY